MFSNSLLSFCLFLVIIFFYSIGGEVKRSLCARAMSDQELLEQLIWEVSNYKFELHFGAPVILLDTELGDNGFNYFHLISPLILIIQVLGVVNQNYYLNPQVGVVTNELG